MNWILYGITISAYVLPEQAATGCPDQFQYQYECSCYYVESIQSTSRPDAQSYCEMASSHLVFIETENEADFLAGIYNTSSQYWLGITGLPDDPKTWMDGTSATYTAFGNHNYTFDEKTGCYRIAPNVSYFQPHTWHDAPCDRSYGYICEYEESECYMDEPSTTQPYSPSETESQTSAGCPEQFQYQYECSCYYVESMQSTSRPDAQSYCEMASSHLVFIETENEGDFLAGIYNTSSQYWLGITGLPDDPKTWMDGSSATYNAFGSHNYTFDEKTGCYRIAPNVSYFQPNTWHDAPCERSYGYICEYEESECSVEPSTTEPLSPSESESQTPAGCPDQFEYRYECSCYYVESIQSTSRPDAQSYCEMASSHLVFIETEDEANFLAGIYNTSSQYWLGITGLPDDPKTWMDGTSATYNAFGSHNYTFDEKTGCYRIAPNVSYFQPNTWHDAPCDRAYGYICEYEESECFVGPSTTEPYSTSESGSQAPADTVSTVTPIVSSSAGTTTAENSIDLSFPLSRSKTQCMSLCVQQECDMVIFDVFNQNCTLTTSRKSSREYGEHFVFVERIFTCRKAGIHFICT